MGATTPEPGPARRGTLVGGRYRLDHPLATGGMARVWTARDEVLNRPVAVKILLDQFVADPSFVARFRAEALAAARLAHPSVVSVYDTCSQDGVEAIVMELVDGLTLRRRLDEEGRLEPAEAARIAARIADGLAVAHRAGIVHRDIKPANVLLSPSGRVVVTDFGIAKAGESGDLTRDQMLGTAKYLSPEQVESRPVDGRSDIYALGVVLYEMVCGRVPFAGDSELATALARLHSDPVAPRDLRPEIPTDLDHVLRRMLEREPENRWPETPSLVRALTAISAGRPLPPEPSRPAAMTSPVPVGSPVATNGVDAAPRAHSPSPAAHPDAPPSPPAPVPVAPEPVPTAVAAPGVERPRRVATLVVAGVVGLSLLVMAALASRVIGSGGGESIESSATAFDPFAGDGENDERATLVTDGDVDTAWSTERYNNRDVAEYKGGVGLLLDGAEQRSFAQVEIQSPSTGWDAEVYVLDGEPGGDSDAWGDRVDGATDISGSETFDLRGRTGRFVLLWITRTAADGRVVVGEARIEAAS